MTDENKGEQPAGDQTDYKTEFEKTKAEMDALKKSNEELKLEFMSEEYLDFLNTKDGVQKPVQKVEPKAAATPDDEWEKLTKKQVYDKAIKDAEEKLTSKLNEFQESQKKESNERTQSEIKKFASAHDDFEAYRSIMYGLSIDPKNSDATLSELYDRAKAHVKSLAGPTDEEKAKSRKAGGEKPGHSSSSFQKSSKKLSADEAAEQAWEEVVGDKGLPASV